MTERQLSGTQRSRRGRLRDFVLYFAIATCVILTAFAAAQAGMDHERFIRWGGLAVNSSILFGYFVADSRPLRRRPSFWLMTCGFLALHLTVFAFFLLKIGQWKLIWFMLMYLEVPPLLYAEVY
jgi:hypothetical protein